jgi:hypothetical protein
MAELPRLAPPEQLRSLADLAACLPAPAWAPHVAQVRLGHGRPVAALHTHRRNRARLPRRSSQRCSWLAGPHLKAPLRGAPWCTVRAASVPAPVRLGCGRAGSAGGGRRRRAARGRAARAGQAGAGAGRAAAVTWRAAARAVGGAARRLRPRARGDARPWPAQFGVCSQASARLVGRALRPWLPWLPDLEALGGTQRDPGPRRLVQHALLARRPTSCDLEHHLPPKGQRLSKGAQRQRQPCCQHGPGPHCGKPGHPRRSWWGGRCGRGTPGGAHALMARAQEARARRRGLTPRGAAQVALAAGAALEAAAAHAPAAACLPSLLESLPAHSDPADPNPEPTQARGGAPVPPVKLCQGCCGPAGCPACAVAAAPLWAAADLGRSTLLPAPPELVGCCAGMTQACASA